MNMPRPPQWPREKQARGKGRGAQGGALTVVQGDHVQAVEQLPLVLVDRSISFTSSGKLSVITSIRFPSLSLNHLLQLLPSRVLIRLLISPFCFPILYLSVL